MNFKRPKTLLSDIAEYKEREFQILQGFVRGWSDKKVDAETRALEEEYSSKIFPEDTYMFSTFRDFEEFILETEGVPPSAKEIILQHEKAHALEAERRGYNCVYSMQFAIDSEGEIVVCPSVWADSEQGVALEDLYSIADAPDEVGDFPLDTVSTAGNDDDLVSLLSFTQKKNN